MEICSNYSVMSHSQITNRGFFRLDLQMEGEPLLEQRKRNNHDVDVESQHLSDYSMEPPRLENSTLCAKMAMGCCLLTCCILMSFVMVAVLNTSPALYMRSIIADVVGPEEVATPQPRPLPAILKRVRTLQRAGPEDHGVTSDSLFAAFPAWKKNGTISAEDALKDLGLIMLMLSNHLPSVAILFEHVEL